MGRGLGLRFGLRVRVRVRLLAAALGRVGTDLDLVDAQVEQTRRVLGDERGHDLLRGRG